MLLSIAYSLKCQDEIVVGYIVTTKSRQKLRVYYSFKFAKKINLSKLATVLTNQPSRPFRGLTID